MPADFRINLAKDITSSGEERSRFYNGMLLYLVSCSALLVLVAYLTSINLSTYLKNKSEKHQLISLAAADGVNKADFKDPQQTYAQLEMYSVKIASLKKLLGQRVQLLPVVHNLFLDLPENVVLQSLSANKSKLAFGLVMPTASDEVGGDPVKELRAIWEKNEELMKRVSTIRPLTGERRTIGEVSMFYVQFECVLNK